MFLAEMFGTMTLIVLGDGVVANVLLNKSKGQNSGWIVITAGWMIAVAMGVFVSNALGGPGGGDCLVDLLAPLGSDRGQGPEVGSVLDGPEYPQPLGEPAHRNPGNLHADLRSGRHLL
jgi:hypothetical protein